MNVCIMYVEISVVYCKNRAEKQVECEDKVMNILMLKHFVYTHTHTITLGFYKVTKETTGIRLCIVCVRVSKFTA